VSQHKKVREKGIQMDYYRKLAISAGVLFIIYDIVAFSSFPFLRPVNATNYLVSASANAGLVGTGALLLIIGGCCAGGIAISLYPVLKKIQCRSSSWSCWFQDF
jgi:ABC-type xylose transport system permease subunit